MIFADWLRKWYPGWHTSGSVEALASLAAQDHKALVELRQAILQHSPCMVHEDCAPAEEQATAAITAGEDFKKQHE